MFWKKAPDIPKVEPIKKVSELVQSFTGEFEKVSKAQGTVIAAQENIIKAAEERKATAQIEQRAADRFIENFKALAEDPVDEVKELDISLEKEIAD
jgi:hypothetical protein